MLNSIKLKNKILKVPIIQGGMGVGISLSNLVGNVMSENAMGVSLTPDIIATHF